MIIETRVFNRSTNKMVYLPPLIATGFDVLADIAKKEMFEATDPIMLKTPMVDDDNTRLWEGDICTCAVVTSYGNIKESGVVVWRADMNTFTININTEYEGRNMFKVISAKRIGNVYENPDLFPKKVEIKELSNEQKN